MSKHAYILGTVRMMENAVSNAQKKHQLRNVYDSLAHRAPEIVDTGWNDIYQYARVNLCDMSNPEHEACLLIYSQRYKDRPKM